MKKIISIIILIAVGITLIISGIYLADKNIVNLFDKNETTEKNTSTEENSNNDISKMKAQKINFDKNNEAKITVDNNNTLIAIKSLDDQGMQSALTINNHKIIEWNTMQSLEDIYVMNDIIIVIFKHGDYFLNTNLYMYDLSGNELQHIYDQLDNSTKGMTINDAKQNPITFKDNKIIINGTRQSTTGFGNYPIKFDNKDIDICNESDLKTNNITSDFIIEAQYELEYLGDNKFSDIKMIEGTSTTLEELQQKCETE